MPLGINNSDPNAAGSSFRKGTPVTLPITFGNVIPPARPNQNTNPQPSTGTEKNVVNWTPSPAHFGNIGMAP